MKKANRWISSTFMVLALMNMYSLVFALQDNETLRGLQGVKVTIIIGSKLLEEMQIENQLQLDAEMKLRMAGIKIVSFDEVSKLPGRPELVLNVNTLKVNNAHITNILISLFQDVRLIRNNVWARGITWSEGWIGYRPAYSLTDQLRRGVKDGSDVFINAYLSVNPK